MPIRPFLNGTRFDPETTRVLGVAFEMVCIALRTGDCDDFVRRAIATKIIDLETLAVSAESGGNPPLLLPTSMLPRVGWKRMPMRPRGTAHPS